MSEVWDDWEFFKLKAEFTGLFVWDKGDTVEFRTQANRAQGIDTQIGVFKRATERVEAGNWLLAHDVNLPGWQP